MNAPARQLEARLGRLDRGTEVTVRGVGRCRYLGARRDLASGEVSWIDVTDPRNGGTRSVAPDRLVRVHRKERLR